MTPRQTGLEQGSPGPLGAHWDGRGVNFAVFSRHGERVELCLFDERGERELHRLALPARTGDVWHGWLAGAAPGLQYGYRVHGPYQPDRGHRFNGNKLLIDPHARELAGRFQWHPALFGWIVGHPEADRSFDVRDSARYMPRCRVAAPLAPPADGRAPLPQHRWNDTVLHELHVRGYTRLHPSVPLPLRGRIEAIAEPAIVDHLRRLGVTAVELLPVAAWVDELDLVRRGLRNYWGYNPLSFFAMQPELAGPRGIAAIADTVERLHRAGIEVILDVVFNHTAEGNHLGPTLSLRGFDNAAYYRLEPGDPGRFQDFTGCGNTLAAHDPAVSGLIVDALRWWADTIGVDGFRFDLASAIARDADGDFDPQAPWLRMLRDDPVLSRRKLIAESWDCTASGHRVGGFPSGFAEWNDRCRDTVRRFWRGDGGVVGDLATRLAGSRDLFGAPGRGPFASVNFVTAHDGFTLADLVSYRHKHNESNGEQNRDGTDNNHSDNCGAEGATGAPAILQLRQRRMRAMLATLMLARGVPMLRAGDEFAGSQRGNNNAYCQDGPDGWVHWPGGHPLDTVPSPAGDVDLTSTIGRLATLRRLLGCLREDRFPDGQPRHADGTADIVWIREDGVPMSAADWHEDHRHLLAMLVDAGRPAPDAPADRVFVAFNGSGRSASFALPATPHGRRWLQVLDTTDIDAAPRFAPWAADDAAAATPSLQLAGPGVAVCVAGAIAGTLAAAIGAATADTGPETDAVAAERHARAGDSDRAVDRGGASA